MDEKGEDMSKEESAATPSRRPSKQREGQTRDRSEAGIELRVKGLENTVKALTDRLVDVDFDIDDIFKRLDSIGETPGKGDYISVSDLRRFLSSIGDGGKDNKK